MSMQTATARFAWRPSAVLLGALFLSACGSREPVPGEVKSLQEMGEESLVVFDLSEGVPESSKAKGWVPMPAERTYAGLLQTIQQVKDNPKVKGLLLRLGTTSFDWAQTEELGRQFRGIRSPERPIVCHVDSITNSSVWFAAEACDHVWLSPAGDADTVGIAGEGIYLKGILERLKIRAEFLHVGKFKSASEMFTEDGPSEASQESMRFVLASIRDAWLNGLAKARTNPQAKEAAEGGPWDAESAKVKGLVDGVGYESDAKQKLQELTQQGADDYVSAYGLGSNKAGSSRISSIIRALTGPETKESHAHIAVLPAVGGIAMTGGNGVTDDGIAADSIVRSIRRLKADKSVKGVVLRINSPGGSALASDLIWHELMLLREQKPLVVSVGSMAASGGYYMACAGNRIFSEQTSIVGSIGVLGGKFTIGEALADYGITTHVFGATDEPSAKRRAAYFSVFEPWDEPTRQRIQQHMEHVYQLFLQRVATGRGLTVEQVHEVAQGRIWTGIQGQERHLVDQLGGLSDAIAYAKQQTGLAPNSSVTIEGGGNPVLELLGLEDGANEQEIRAASARALAAQPSWLQLLKPSERRVLQSIWPLLQGERVLAVTPFVIEPQ
jgi:protease IV